MWSKQLTKQSKPAALFDETWNGVQRVLVANRGECAMRIMRTCNKIGITAIAVYESDDSGSLHVVDGGANILEEITSYVDQEELIRVAKKTNADSVHPGYGFLSEHAGFASRCVQEGLVWLGPSPEVIEKFGRKDAAREVAIAAGVPVTPGSPCLNNASEAVEYAGKIGFPIILKPAGGGGGIGMQVCWTLEEVSKAFTTAADVAGKFFGDASVFMEKYVASSHHIEVQVFGDGLGNCIHFGERECSVQRRQQKVIEETPSPNLTPSARVRVCNCAVDLCKYVNYGSAGTVEFIYDAHSGEFYFLEVNTRLQVEHGVTEMVNDVDIVEMMIKQGSDATRLNLDDIVWSPKGSAIQLRIYAEDPLEGFKPAPGILQEFYMPRDEPDTRFETWAYAGCHVTPKYDPMIVKILQWGKTRPEAISRLRTTVSKTKIGGPPNNLGYLEAFLASPMFISGNTPCDVLNGFSFESSSFVLMEAPLLGLTVQDFPGRQDQGLWRIGVPPSGPMDHLNARLANSIVGNEESAGLLEMTMKGFSLRVRCESMIAVTGAKCTVRINGIIMPRYTAHTVRAGGKVEVSDVDQSCAGVRCYFAIRGGVDVPLYLGSRSTFTGGKLGGYQGRDLQAGDVLPVGKAPVQFPDDKRSLKEDLWPVFPEVAADETAGSAIWEIGVTIGPHAAPDFVTENDLDTLFNSHWTVHHNSNRLGMRFEGPKLQFARTDGGEGGNHPSNIVDCAYALGTLNFTGDSPVIITHDGPSLGGFICPVTVPQSELWKAGQLRAGDKVRFKPMHIQTAVLSRLRQNLFIKNLVMPKGNQLIHPAVDALSGIRNSAILFDREAGDDHPGFVVRLAGDSNVLIEYGPGHMDMAYRVRLHFLEQKLVGLAVPGFNETLPGVRSLQVRHDPLTLPLNDLLNLIVECDASISLEGAKIPLRVFHLPMTWDHSCVDVALNRYQNGVRAEAAYLPRNIDFIAEANGLGGEAAVRDMVYRASYMCMGLGDVYLGAPCAVPVDPRDRVVVPKFNPARTWTQEGTVGLGGAYMCIYPMESPGGYQLIGRTLPIWNSYPHRKNMLFNSNEPWMLRMFDQVRFYPCEEAELERLRGLFRQGLYHPRVEEEFFDLDEHKHFLTDSDMNAQLEDIKYQRAISAEKIAAAVNAEVSAPSRKNMLKKSKTMPASAGNTHTVFCAMNAVVCQVNVEIGQVVQEGDTIFMLEAMKMEFPVKAGANGKVIELMVQKGDRVDQMQDLALLEKMEESKQRSASVDLADLPTNRQSLSLSALDKAYRTGACTPSQVVHQIFNDIEQSGRYEVFIHLCERETVLAAARALERDPRRTVESCPLYGIPFVVKDNIDVGGLPTTAACPQYRYTAKNSAICVERLLNAGAILIGKTNLDQFATGLVGTRSPYGAVRNSFNPEYISGGSSSGSAVSVAMGFACFSLGTDTAGSGRVPAMFNNIVGLKPSLRRVPNTGVVPACKTIDSVTCFALSCDEAQTVVNVMSDPQLVCPAFSRVQMDTFTFGVPAPEQLNFFGNDEGFLLLEAACRRLEKLGGTRVEIDFSPFLDCAQALYGSALVSQRLEATNNLLNTNADAIDPTVRSILRGAQKYSAMDVYAAQEMVNQYKIQAENIMNNIDVLVTPTAPRCYTIKELEEKPLELNKNVGYYTNFMNLFDMSAVAIPAGFHCNGLPFGITISAERMRDAYLCCLGQAYQQDSKQSVGAIGEAFPMRFVAPRNYINLGSARTKNLATTSTDATTSKMSSSTSQLHQSVGGSSATDAEYVLTKENTIPNQVDAYAERG